MPTFRVTVPVTGTMSFMVEADTAEEAIEQAELDYENGEGGFDSDDTPDWSEANTKQLDQGSAEGEAL